MYPGSGRIAETEYHKADDFRVTPEGVDVLNDDGNVLASYPTNGVISVRRSKHRFSSDRVTFVRRFVRKAMA
jgi:hypothetical protein